MEQLSTKLCHNFSPCARVKEEQAGHGDDDDEVKNMDMENGHGEVEVKIFVIGSVLWESKMDGIWLPVALMVFDNREELGSKKAKLFRPKL